MAKKDKTPHKIKSVLETARYKIGMTAYWVVMRPRYKPSKHDFDQSGMLASNNHPKELFIRGPFKKSWKRSVSMPKLHAYDFMTVVNLLTCDIIVEKYEIIDVIRSNETGEFIYSNKAGEWMPESLLCDSEVAARREQNRIIKMIKDWHLTQA